MLGYLQPPRDGVLWIDTIDDDPAIAECVANVSGYDTRPIDGIRVPTRVVIELPCSIALEGPPGTNLIVIAWEVKSTGSERGAGRTYRREGADATGLTVPLWARSYDWIPEDPAAVGTFRDGAGTAVGVLPGAHALQGYSIPDRAVSIDLTAGNQFIVFRQQG